MLGPNPPLPPGARRWPGYLPYPKPLYLQRPKGAPVPNAMFGFWGQGQFMKPYLPPGSGSVPPFRYPKYSRASMYVLRQPSLIPLGMNTPDERRVLRVPPSQVFKRAVTHRDDTHTRAALEKTVDYYYTNVLHYGHMNPCGTVKNCGYGYEEQKETSPLVWIAVLGFIGIIGYAIYKTPASRMGSSYYPPPPRYRQRGISLGGKGGKGITFHW